MDHSSRRLYGQLLRRSPDFVFTGDERRSELSGWFGDFRPFSAVDRHGRGRVLPLAAGWWQDLVRRPGGSVGRRADSCRHLHVYLSANGYYRPLWPGYRHHLSRRWFDADYGACGAMAETFLYYHSLDGRHGSRQRPGERWAFGYL